MQQFQIKECGSYKNNYLNLLHTSHQLSAIFFKERSLHRVNKTGKHILCPAKQTNNKEFSK